LRPDTARTVSVIDGSTVPFAWDTVAGADYYRCQIFPGAAPLGNGTDVPVFEQQFIKSGFAETPLGSFDNGSYHAVIQAFAVDTDYSTRIIGYTKTVPFRLHKLKPVELKSPARGSTIEGIDARRTGLRFEWVTGDQPENLSLVLKRNGSPYKTDVEWKQGSSSVQIDRLPDGKYEWTVKATVEDFDISPLRASTFTVNPIPLLPSSALVTPPNSKEFGPDYLRDTRTISFSWNAVPGATHYRFRILNAKTLEPVLTREQLSATSFVLEDLSVLDRGDFVWEITAQNYWTDGILEQDGNPARFRFRIELPAVRAPTKAGGSEYYGY
jgi:hypothetical protein